MPERPGPTGRREEAARLRAEGATYSEIAEQLGCAYQTAYGWCNPSYEESNRRASRERKLRRKTELAAYDREYYQTHLKPCSACGQRRKPYHAKGGICQDCIVARKEANWDAIELAWKVGLSMTDIARSLGWSRNHLGSEMRRMRVAGRDLPYRRNASRVVA